MIDYDFLYNKDYYAKFTDVEHFVDKELSYQVLHNVTLLPYIEKRGLNMPGGLIKQDGSYIDGSGLHRGLGCSYRFNKKKVKNCDETIVYMGMWPNIWGHVFTDNIRRLWVLNDTRFMEKFGKLKFVYISYMDQTPGNNALELLRIIGADSVRIERVNEITRYKTVIYPDECFYREADGNRYFTKEYVDMIDILRNYGINNFVDTGVRKVYFSHRGYSNIRAIGEYRLEGFFKRLGFKVISPENYSFEQQLSILLSCTHYASTVGSVSHNLIFLRDNTNVYLIPRADFISEYQFALDQVHPLNIKYVDSTLSMYVHPDHPHRGPFFYIISDNILKCFGKKMKRRNNYRGFTIYRYLGYLMNGCQSPGDYYINEYEKYLFPQIKEGKLKELSKKRIEENTLLQKLCCKYKIQRVFDKAIHRFELVIEKRRPDR